MFTLEQPGVFLQKEILHCYKCLLSLAKIVFTCQRFCCTPLSSTLNKKSCRVTRLNNHTVERRKMKNELKRLQEHICKRDHDAHKEFSAKGMRNAQAPGWSKLRAPLFLVGDSWIEAAVGNGLNERNHAKLLTAAVFAKNTHNPWTAKWSFHLQSSNQSQRMHFKLEKKIWRKAKQQLKNKGKKHQERTPTHEHTCV